MHHQRTQRIHLIAERVGFGDGSDPTRHHADGINCIAGEEERHGQDLADAHKTLAGFHQAGNGQGKSREQSRPQDDKGDHSGHMPGGKIQMDAEQQRQNINNDSLSQSAYSRRKRFAKNKSGTRRRTDQQFLQNAQVSFPDHADAIENRDEQHALRENAGNHEGEVIERTGWHGADAAEDLAEDQEPQGGLNRTRQQLCRIALQLSQFDIGKRQRVANEIADASCLT